MKKLLSILICFALCVSICSCALAQEAKELPTALNLNAVQLYESALSLCWLENDLYILGTYAIYHWAEGMETPDVYYDLSSSAAYQYAAQPPKSEEDAQAWAKAIRYLFTDGETLYGLHPYNGQVFEIAHEKMQEAALLPADLLKGGTEEDSFIRDIKSTAYVNGELFLLLGTDNYSDYAKTELVSFRFADESSKARALAGAQGLAAGADGKLAIFTEAEECAIWQYDIASETFDLKLASFKPNEISSGMVWYAAKDALAYYAANRVALVNAAGQSQTKAYLPVSYARSTTPAACSQSGIYAYPYSSRVFIRDISIDGETTQTALNLIGALSPDLIIDFSIENPDIAVVSLNASSSDYLKQAVISANSDIDLMVASAPGDFAAMKTKGFAAALNSSSELVSMAQQLYPTIQNAIFDGDSLLGYPIAFQPLSWTINESKWQEFGLGDYPTTYDQLFRIIAIWLDDYAEDNRDYTLCDIQQSSIDTLVSLMIKEYIFQNETTGERLTFDTPAFRSLLSSVVENAHLLSQDNEQWGMPLLYSYYQGFGITYNDSDRMHMLLSPTLDSQKTQMLNARMEVLVVNAASLKQDAANRFVSFCAQHMDAGTKYTLSPNQNEPLRNPAYESRLETLNAELQSLQNKLDSADESQTALLRDEITQKENLIASFSDNEWSISPKSIDMYRQIAQNLRVPYDTAFPAEDEASSFGALSSVVAQYCTDGLTADEIDAFIADLDRVTYLVFMEDK
ncbi:MAG: hypothetical protein GX096_03940 [Clostridiales bacterium]|nr:hypothetical protein [Clostridiales bacterium]